MKDGYPEEHELSEIKDWGVGDPQGLIDYIRRLWTYEDFFKWDGKNLELHTGGWSGNEDIISTLHESMFWMMYWQKSERGGHYYFTVG